jgi:anti-sigma28 factor (negative regulator of flagellin synthesis)
MKALRCCQPYLVRARLRMPSVVRRKNYTLEAGKISRSRSAEVQKYINLARKLPEVRRDKVDSVKKQIRSGKYKTCAESVAKSIFDHI